MTQYTDVIDDIIYRGTPVESIYGESPDEIIGLCLAILDQAESESLDGAVAIMRARMALEGMR